MPETDPGSMSDPQTTVDTIADKAGEVLRAVAHLRGRLQSAWEEINECAARARARIPEYKQELRDEAGRVSARARYYHQNRPLAVLGAIAATAFVAGIAIGLGRR